MNTRRSRPSSSIPTGNEAPSKPACLTARRKAWIEPECGLEARRTCGPTRTTRPAFAIPPSSCCSATPPPRPTNGAAARGPSTTACAHRRDPTSGEVVPSDRPGVRRLVRQRCRPSHQLQPASHGPHVREAHTAVLQGVKYVTERRWVGGRATLAKVRSPPRPIRRYALLHCEPNRVPERAASPEGAGSPERRVLVTAHRLAAERT